MTAVPRLLVPPPAARRVPELRDSGVRPRATRSNFDALDTEQTEPSGAPELLARRAPPAVPRLVLPAAASKPAASKPAALKRAASKPAASKPAASKPAASKPAASKPAASKPAALKPAAIPPPKPAATAPQAPTKARAAAAPPRAALPSTPSTPPPPTRRPSTPPRSRAAEIHPAASARPAPALKSHVDTLVGFALARPEPAPPRVIPRGALPGPRVIAAFVDDAFAPTGNPFGPVTDDVDLTPLLHGSASELPRRWWRAATPLERGFALSTIALGGLVGLAIGIASLASSPSEAAPVAVAPSTAPVVLAAPVAPAPAPLALPEPTFAALHVAAPVAGSESAPSAEPVDRVEAPRRSVTRRARARAAARRARLRAARRGVR